MPYQRRHPVSTRDRQSPTWSSAAIPCVPCAGRRPMSPLSALDRLRFTDTGTPLRPSTSRRLRVAAWIAQMLTVALDARASRKSPGFADCVRYPTCRAPYRQRASRQLIARATHTVALHAPRVISARFPLTRRRAGPAPGYRQTARRGIGLHRWTTSDACLPAEFTESGCPLIQGVNGNCIRRGRDRPRGLGRRDRRLLRSAGKPTRASGSPS